jgi:hypothetical protein
MLSFINSFMSWYLKKRIPVLKHNFSNGVEVQEQMFKSLLSQVQKTSFGRDFKLKEVSTIDQYRTRVPLFHYDDIKPYIQRVMQGEQKVLWPGDINWFAKSSGTTSDKSKFIPVSYDSLEDCQFRGSRDIIAWYYQHNPEANIFQGKGLIIGGSHQVNELSPNSYYGDLSAVMMNNLPFIANYLVTPSMDIALMSNWEEKLYKMIDSTYQENVTNISGVPSWTLLLLKGVLEKTKAATIKEVWPNLELYVHGGVSFEPYREQFNEIIGDSNMQYRETYNASEGFFGIQDTFGKEMSLMVDYGIFYEFVLPEDLEQKHPKSLWLDEIELGVNYAIILNTNAGLWRYVIGDTIKFVSKDPYRFVITGRTKSFINAFGEELMVENSEKAISIAQRECNCVVFEYTAAPVYISDEKQGMHEWAIEFTKEPKDLNQFIKVLDRELMNCNSDYEAKRKGNLILLPPKVNICKSGTFYNWLRANDKLGGQHKVPKLNNNRRILEQVLHQHEQI